MERLKKFFKKNKIIILILNPKEYIRLPQSEIEDIKNLAREIKDESLLENFNKYRVDYLVWDEEQNPNWDINDYSFLNMRFRENNISIFEVGL